MENSNLKFGLHLKTPEKGMKIKDKISKNILTVAVSQNSYCETGVHIYVKTGLPWFIPRILLINGGYT
jgi:hypothetical protein